MWEYEQYICGENIVAMEGYWFVESNAKIFEEVLHLLNLTREGGKGSIFKLGV